MTKEHAGLDDRRAETPDSEVQRPPEGGQPQNEDLGKVVDDLENRVTEERRSENVPGNVDDREEQPPVESGDEAPE